MVRRVVVTGLGTVNPLGSGVEVSWEAILAGKSGAAPVTRCVVDDLASRIACQVPRGDEPGAFDPATLDEFQTAGIALFMQLPGHRAASLVFELMLNTAQRLAQALRGEVLDDTRQPLSSQSIDLLRALVKQYDRG